MNFFGHATVACSTNQHPLFVLGSMLPDFATMCGTRLGHVSIPEVAAGVDFHHRVDEIFHRSDIFIELCTKAVRKLRSKSIRRSSSRAIAHAGTELLLDGLLGEKSSVYKIYNEALETGRTQEVLNNIKWGTPIKNSDLLYLLNQLQNSHIIQNYANPSFVAVRLYNILSERTALAFHKKQIVIVTEWAEKQKFVLSKRKNELMEHIYAEISSTVNVDYPSLGALHYSSETSIPQRLPKANQINNGGRASGTR